MTSPRSITERDRRRARRCLECLVCRRARTRQRGLAFRLVKTVERKLCPYCRAYAHVYGRQAHEPMLSENGRGG